MTDQVSATKCFLEARKLFLHYRCLLSYEAIYHVNPRVKRRAADAKEQNKMFVMKVNFIGVLFVNTVQCPGKCGLGPLPGVSTMWLFMKVPGLIYGSDGGSLAHLR